MGQAEIETTERYLHWLSGGCATNSRSAARPKSCSSARIKNGCSERRSTST
jgi:hypothetical protein